MFWNRKKNDDEGLPFTYKALSCMDGTAKEFFVAKYWVYENGIVESSYADSDTVKNAFPMGTRQLQYAYRFESAEEVDRVMQPIIDAWRLEYLKSQVRVIE